MENIQIKRLNKFRERLVFSVLGFIYYDGNLVWTGEMFDTIVILEEKIKQRHLYFNEWNYQIEWTDWKFKYQLIKVL